MKLKNRAEGRRELLGFLRANIPRTRKAFREIWKEMRKEITGDAVQQSIDMNAVFLQERLRAIYNEGIEGAVSDQIERAALAGGNGVSVKQLDSTSDRIKKIIAGRRDILKRLVGERDVDNLIGVMQRIVGEQTLGTQAVAKRLQEFVGLNRKQQDAMRRRIDKLREEGLTETQIDRAVRSSSRVALRSRENILAHHEMVTVFNQAKVEGVNLLQEEGEIGRTIKEWVTLLDEAVECICEPMEGVKVELNEDFVGDSSCPFPDGPLPHPPAHTLCRCTVVFQEQV